MPTYCYSNDDRSVKVERFYPACRPPRKIRHQGKWLYRDIPLEHGQFRDITGGWPMWSSSAGVHPDQIPAAVEEARRHGVRAEFDSEGRVKFEDRAHRAKLLRAFGMHDRDGGYRETPRNR